MTAGYSGTPLIKKLGYKSGMKVFVINAPENYLELLGDRPEDILFVKKSSSELDLIHWFLDSQNELLKKLESVKKQIKKDGMIWLSWPKKSSRKPTDLDENIIRNAILDCGLVDVKVCAVDETWSGLKAVYRLKDR